MKNNFLGFDKRYLITVEYDEYGIIYKLRNIQHSHKYLILVVKQFSNWEDITNTTVNTTLYCMLTLYAEYVKLIFEKKYTGT